MSSLENKIVTNNPVFIEAFVSYTNPKALKQLFKLFVSFLKDAKLIAGATFQRLKKRGYVSLTQLHLQLNPSLGACPVFFGKPPST